jgi:hypothetical protein
LRNSAFFDPKAFFGGKFGRPLKVAKLNCFFTWDWKDLILEYLSLKWNEKPPGAITLTKYST